MKTKEFESVSKDGEKTEVLFKKPTQGILSKGDFVYRTEFSKAIRAGIMTTAEANKLLRDRGIWDDERESQESTLRLEIGSLETALAEEDSYEDGIRLFDKLKELRASLNELTQVYSSISENTAESVASEVRTQFFASECSVYKDSSRRVFSSFDDFKKRLDEQITVDCYRNALISNWEEALGISIDELTDSLPEDEWLKKTAPKVEEPEPKVEDKVEEVVEEPAPKPKRRRRKKKKTEDSE
jgi:BMFP domain-containing protein YqiC